VTLLLGVMEVEVVLVVVMAEGVGGQGCFQAALGCFRAALGCFLAAPGRQTHHHRDHCMACQLPQLCLKLKTMERQLPVPLGMAAAQ